MSYQRKREDKRRLKKLYYKTQHAYGNGAYFSERKNRLIRYTCHDKDFKHITVKTTRRKINNIDYEINPKGCSYKKIYDYWYIVT